MIFTARPTARQRGYSGAWDREARTSVASIRSASAARPWVASSPQRSSITSSRIAATRPSSGTGPIGNRAALGITTRSRRRSSTSGTLV
jgi:hypothetical protein